MLLHRTEFRYTIPRDENRAMDGLELRRRFAHDRNSNYISRCLTGPCSVLEMMVALAIRCEEHIMGDPDFGDRTGNWFWGMIENLELIFMTDARFDRRYAEKRIDIFLDRTYEADGTGGLFTAKHCCEDMRTLEIWYQMCWYLDDI